MRRGPLLLALPSLFAALVLGGCDRASRDHLSGNIAADEGRPLNESLAADIAQPPPETSPPPPPATAATTSDTAVAAPAAPPAAPVTADVVPPLPDAAGGAPSFDCGMATTDAEIWVCDDPDLVALDWQMAGAYGRARAHADPATRDRLRQTGRRFIARRNACGDPDCVIAAYHHRIGEIAAIAGP